MYKDEFNVANFLAHPDILIGQALTLRYKPVDLDVLPLYIVLVAACPLILWSLLRRPNWTLLGSVVLYALARWFDWNLPSYPPGTSWYFNPFAWQLLFVFAAWCGVGGLAKIEPLIRSRAALTIAFAWLAFAFVIVMTWHAPWLEALIPKWMIKAIYPIDKTDLDLLRLTHFLAVATVVTRFFPRKDSILASKWLRPLILCGQHSLPIFCFGVFLSFGSHWILTQYKHGVWEQFAVSFGGMADHGCDCMDSGSGFEGPRPVRRRGRDRARSGDAADRQAVIRRKRQPAAGARSGGKSGERGCRSLQGTGGPGRTGHAPHSALRGELAATDRQTAWSEMTDTVVEAKLTEERIAGSAGQASPRRSSAWIARFDAYDLATIVVIAVVAVLALCSFRDYAISNDEAVQHHYGELILDYYASGFAGP